MVAICECTFIVGGEPVPEGSTSSFYIKKLNRVVTTHQGQKKLLPYRKTLTDSFLEEKGDLPFIPTDKKELKNASYEVWIRFYFTKPINPMSPYKNTRPDLDKCIRAVLDSLTKHAYMDDGRVTSITAHKSFAEVEPETVVTIRRLT